jgi:hypothetical protein
MQPAALHRGVAGCVSSSFYFDDIFLLEVFLLFFPPSFCLPLPPTPAPSPAYTHKHTHTRAYPHNPPNTLSRFALHPHSGMDPLELEVAKESGGTEEERVQATAVWSVVARHHWLLCTLLLINAAANEALPLCLNEVAPPAAVILVSVTLVLIFGEILPSAGLYKIGEA